MRVTTYIGFVACAPDRLTRHDATWLRISALAPLPPPDARELWGAASLGTPAGVACIGGAVSAESSARVWLYDERADRWEAGTGMATARWCGAAARIVGRE